MSRKLAEVSPPNRTFPWVSITPLGSPVVPVVYNKTATSSAISDEPPTDAATCIEPKLPVTSTPFNRSAWYWASVETLVVMKIVDGLQCPITRVTSASVWRAFTGTTQAPIFQAANRTATAATQFSDSSKTRSPDCTPLAIRNSTTSSHAAPKAP